MTISTTIIKNSYNGDGIQDVFPYNFKVLNQSDVEVILRGTDGSETVKTISTHYTVSGVGEATGGNVTFTAGNEPITGVGNVILRRATTKTQTLDLVENDPFTADSVEGAFDRSIAIAQELQEAVDRSIKISRTNTMTSTEFTVDAANRANKVLAFDGSGELSIAQTLGDYKGDWSTATSFNERDFVKDTSTNNIYLCIVAHTSTGTTPITSNADVAKWELIVDAAAATSAAATATAKAVDTAADALTTAGNVTTVTRARDDAVSAKDLAESTRDVANASRDTANASRDTAISKAGEASVSAVNAAASATSAAASAGGGVVRVTSTDTNANVLNEKFLAGTDITFEVQNAGADEKILIAAPFSVVYAIALGG